MWELLISQNISYFSSKPKLKDFFDRILHNLRFHTKHLLEDIFIKAL